MSLADLIRVLQDQLTHALNLASWSWSTKYFFLDKHLLFSCMLLLNSCFLSNHALK